MGDEASVRGEFGRAFRQLMQWAAQANATALPKPVRHRSSLVLADDVAAMVLGAREPEVRTAIAQFAATSFAPQATIFRRGVPAVDRFSAAAANGMAVSWCELDEGFRRAPCHGGAYALPAILAEAEFRDRSVEDVLRALAIAYEIAARIALAFKFEVMTVHPHAALANIGAAAGTALMQNADAALLEAAISGACAMTFAGPFNHAVHGALVRNAWTSAGAWIGMKSVDWATAGIAGLAETPFDVFATVFGGQCHVHEMTDALGTEWAIASGYHKMIACCQYAHSAVEANLVLMSRLAASGRDAGVIEDITVETHRLGLALTNAAPATTLAAKFSLPHAMAATAVMGTGGFDAFTQATLADPAIATLRQRVRLMPHPDVGPPPNDRPARVSWRLASGETWQATCESAKGGADNPYDEAALLNKIAHAVQGEFPNMPATLETMLADSGAAPDRPWRAVLADMLRGGDHG